MGPQPGDLGAGVNRLGPRPPRRPWRGRERGRGRHAARASSGAVVAGSRCRHQVVDVFACRQTGQTAA